MTRLSATLAIALLVPELLHAQGTIQVRFAESRFAVMPGSTFPVVVVMDPIPEGGLFGFGVKLVFDGKLLRLDGLGAVMLPAALDFNGPLGAGAFKSIQDNAVAIRGSIDPLAFPPSAYSGKELVQITFTETGGAPGSSHELHLEIYRTIGSTETVFVSGNGQSLDGRLQFGSAVFQVIPEPAPGWIIFSGAITGLWMVRQSRNTHASPGKETDARCCPEVDGRSGGIRGLA